MTIKNLTLKGLVALVTSEGKRGKGETTYDMMYLLDPSHHHHITHHLLHDPTPTYYI